MQWVSHFAKSPGRLCRLDVDEGRLCSKIEGAFLGSDLAAWAEARRGNRVGGGRELTGLVGVVIVTEETGNSWRSRLRKGNEKCQGRPAEVRGCEL